jgi:hypothetical protein
MTSVRRSGNQLWKCTGLCTLGLLVPLLCVAPGSVQAQSGESGFLGKQGVIIGLGLGGAFTSISTETTQFGVTSDVSVSSAALAGDFKFGLGLSEQVLLYWFGKSGLYHGEDSFGVATKTATVVALSGIGASYYLTRRMSVAAGLGVISLTNNRQTAWGGGLAVGTAYEVASHWMIELDLVFGQPKPDELPAIERSTSSLLVKCTLNWLYY